MFSPTVVGTANALAGGIGNSGNDANNLFSLDCTALYYTAFDSPEVHGQGADSPSCSSNLRISRRSAHSVSQLVTTAGLVRRRGLDPDHHAVSDAGHLQECPRIPGWRCLMHV